MSLEEIEKRRADRKEHVQKERDAQYEIDLEELDKLEEEHGDARITNMNVPHKPGLPTMAICRCAKPAEVKRYRDRTKGKTSKGVQKPGDARVAAEEVAASCRLYPEAELYAQMCEACPGLHAQLGVAAMDLAMAEREDEEK